MIYEQLREKGIPCFPCWARYNQAKGKWDKGPAGIKGESWQLTAYRPAHDPQLNWQSGVVGIPVPAGVVIVDLDTYKGVSRQQVEQYLNVKLDWDAALIQRTLSGGEHYAFKCDWDVKQGDSIGVTGLDTRSAGKGFICSGTGYTQAGTVGVFALATPELLPVLPEGCKPLLQRHETVAVAPPAAVSAGEAETALRYIDPNCARAEWLRVGLALKSLFPGEGDTTGHQIYSQWSSGALWSGSAPSNYVQEHIDEQWPGFKAEGGTSGATLFYMAIQAGWRPPAKFDTSEAFAGNDEYDALITAIRRDGADIAHTPKIIHAIQQSSCSALQVALLTAELKQELASGGLKGKKLTAQVDKLLSPVEIDRQEGVYGKVDADNVAIFTSKYYPNGTLVRCDGSFYAYTGKVWERTTDDVVKHKVARDMYSQRMQESRVNSAYRAILQLSEVLDGALNQHHRNLIVFDNGVLNMKTKTLHTHDKRLFTTNILPYPYQPGTLCPRWCKFLDDVFSADIDRIELLQEWLGYLMTREYKHQKIMIMLGSARCGKGTIGRVIQQLVGAHNFSGGSLAALSNDSTIDALSEKTALFIGDAAKRVNNSNVNNVIERLKAISGNDEISWHRMYHGVISRTIPTRITLAANNIPQLFDDSGALASRMLLLTFDKTYLGREDLTLGTKLAEEIAGIAQWALKGLDRLKQNGRFTSPAAAREELEFLEEMYSPLIEFINDRCVLDGEVTCTGVELYTAYKVWVSTWGDNALPRRAFTAAIKDATRGKGVHYGTYRGDNNVVSRGFKGIKPRDSVPAKLTGVVSSGY